MQNDLIKTLHLRYLPQEVNIKENIKENAQKSNKKSDEWIKTQNITQKQG